MRLPLYIVEYDDRRAARAKRASHLGRGVDWAARIPLLWRSLTIGPLWVDVHRDADAGAERWIGYDEDERPCYCRHVFAVQIGRWGLPGQPVSGAVGCPEGSARHAEDLAAWRMRDGRWLIHRIIHPCGTGHTSYAFYAFSEEMPR